MSEEYKSDYLTIHNDKGLEATLSTLGAGVKSLTLHGEPLILELKEDKDYLGSNQFFGKTLGRVAGRMPSEFKLGQKTFNLPGDEQKICLHGGIFEGLSFRNFKNAVQERDGYVATGFHYDSPEGEAGYPGNLSLNVLYLMKQDELEFSIYYEAYSDRDTYLSLSNHMYWNIFHSKDVNDYKLQVNASRTGAFKEGTQLIIGSQPVPDCLDFRKMTDLKTKLDQIQKDLGKNMTLDHTYLLDDVNINKPAVILDTPKLRLETYTDFDAVNFYVDSSHNPWDFKNRDDIRVGERRAIAIEPESFPTLDNIFLEAGKVYRHKIIYKLYEKKKRKVF